MSVPPNCEMDELAEENRFVYTANEELPSLQEMASCQVALAIWNGYISRCFFNKEEINSDSCPPSFQELFGHCSTYQKDTDKLVESLRTPRSIEAILKTSLERIRKEMKQCVRYFSYRAVFFKYRITTFKPHWCVWLPNGKIDYLKTANIMVSPENSELDLKQKFCIMCEFFMEEKLKGFPLDSLPADFIQFCRDADSARYWIACLKGEWNESYDYRMIADIKFNEMAGFQMNHFWHRLSDDDQVKLAYRLFVGRDNVYREKWQTVEPVLGSMSWDQQRRFLSMPRAAKQTIIFSCRYSSSSKCAIWAWKHCRDITTAEEFCAILRDIFKMTWDIVQKDVIVPTVLELWDLAYEHQKKFSVTDLESLLFHILYLDKSSATRIYYSSSTYTLLNKCLAPKSLNDRKALIMKFAIRLGTGTLDPGHMQEILDLNLPHPDDQTEFKKCVINSKEMKWQCAVLWVDGNFDILNANVEFYCDGDLSSIQQYNQKLLSEVTSKNWARFADKSVITDIDKWQKCCEFIDNILPNDPAEALVAKQQFVSQFLKCDSFCKSKFEHFDLAVRTVENVFPNEAELTSYLNGLRSAMEN